MIRVIPNYVDFKYLNQVDDNLLGKLRREFKKNPKEIILMTLGWLHPVKGVQFLIEAMAKIVKKYTHIRLLVVGAGPYENDLRGLVNSFNVEEYIHFLGKRSDCRELLHISDFFVLPSLSEGLPLVLLEALAVGRTCIVSDIPQVQGIINNLKSSFLFKSGNVEDLVRVIDYAVSNPYESKKVACEGQKYVKKYYNITENIKLLEQLYDELKETVACN